MKKLWHVPEDWPDDSSYSPEEGRRFRSRVAFNLSKLGRIEEASAVYDSLIAEATGHPGTKWGLLRDKAQMLTSADHRIEALRRGRPRGHVSNPGTMRWLETEVLRSRLLARVGNLTEAIAGLDAALNERSLRSLDRATLLVEKAIVLSTAHHHKEAATTADCAEQVLHDIEGETLNEPGMKRLREKLRELRGDDSGKHKPTTPPNAACPQPRSDLGAHRERSEICSCGYNVVFIFIR